MSLENFIGVILSLLTPILAGNLFFRLIFDKTPCSFPATLAISYGIGMGFITHLMMLLSWAQIPCTPGTVTGPLVITSLLGIILVSRKHRYSRAGNTCCLSRQRMKMINPEFLSLSVLKRIIVLISVLFIGFQIVFVWWRASSIPICTWDALYVIASKAKCVFYERSLTPLQYYNLSSYPLHVPLSMAWIAINIGKWSEQIVKIIFPIIYLGYLAVHFAFLSRYTDRWWATVGVAMLVSSSFFNYHATIAYRDFYLMFYNMSAILSIIIGLDEKNDRFFVLAGIMSGLAVFTKLEAWGYLFLHASILLFSISGIKGVGFKKKLRAAYSFFIPSMVFLLPYFLYKNWLGISQAQNRLRYSFSLQESSRILVILERFADNIFLSGNWNILWFLLVVSFALHWAKAFDGLSKRILSAFLVMSFTLYFLVALFTPNFVSLAGPHSYTVLSRVFLHFFPLCPLLIILLNYPGFREADR